MGSVVALSLYQLKITLHGSEPPIWRRVLVEPDTTTLRTLHEIIQRSMGWNDSHRHQFDIQGQMYECGAGGFGGDSEDEYGDDHDDDSEDNDDDAMYRKDTKYTLSQLINGKEKFKFLYTYDMWDHVILVEKIVPRRGEDNSVEYPTCTGGKMKCPPDDCGGIDGYYDILATMDPKHPEHTTTWEEWMDEVGDDPTAFDVDQANEQLSYVGCKYG